MNINELEDGCKKYKESETGLEKFYDIALSIVDDHTLQASIIILATWNKSRFGKYVNKFDISALNEKLKEIEPFFIQLKDEEFQSMDLYKHKENIKKIYDALMPIKGIEFTGATKIMSLRNCRVFVMWDEYIRGEKSKKYYLNLDILRKGWKLDRKGNAKKYKRDSDGYFEFLIDMKEMFGNIGWNDKNKTLAKAIDEYNFVNITKKIQEQEKSTKPKK